MTAAHALGTEEAKRRLRAKLEAARSRYGVRASDLHEAWKDGTLSFAFTVMGVSVKGTMVVEDRAVRLSAQLPFAVAIFKGAIERRIRAELGDLLS
jgi:hypothetical protein